MEELSLARRAWLLIVLSGCVLMVLSGLLSFFPAAVPIAKDTDATQAETIWIVDVFTLTMAATLLPAGAIGDRFGRRGVMNLGMGLLLVVSVLALLADTPEQLIAVRAVQGLAGGLVLPSTLSLITTIFSKDRRQQAVTIWAAVMMISGTFGMMASAILIEFYSWRSILWMLAGLAAATFALGWTIPTSKDEVPPRFDAVGALLGAVVCGAAVFGLIEGGHSGWTDPVVLLSFAGAAVAVAVFVVVELRVPDPMLDVRVFRSRPFAAGAITLGITYAVLYGDFYVGLQYLQYAEDMSPLLATSFTGGAVAVGAIPMVLLTVWLGPRMSLRTALAVGLGVSVLAVLLLSMDTFYRSEWWVAGLFALTAAGVGLNTGAASNAIVENVPENKQGVASAVNHATRDIGIAFAVALFGSLQSSAYRDDIGPASEPLPETVRDSTRESIVAALAVADQSGAAGVGLATAARDAFTHGTQFANVVVGVGLFAITVGVAFLAPGRTAHPRSRPAPAVGLTGLLRSMAGVPLQGAGITLIDARGRQVARCTSGVDGRFAVPAAGSGEHLLVAVAEGWCPAVVRIADVVADDELDLVLTASRSLRVSTSTTGGTPLVTVFDPESGRLERRKARSDGSCEFELPAGQYVVTTTAPGCPPTVRVVDLGPAHTGAAELAVVS